MPPITSTSSTRRRGAGRPPSSLGDKRYPMRTSDEKLAAYRTAAATCGVDLQAWIDATLTAEARKATHVALVSRKAARRG